MLGADVIVPVPLIPGVPILAAMGALSTILVNRNVSVFHDGLRPLMPSLRSGEMTRAQVAKVSFSLALAFIWAFGLPYSVGAVIPLIYLVYIATDYIGVRLPATYDKRWWQSRTNLGGVVGSLILGAAWGAGIALLLHYLAVGMANLPVPMAAGTALFTAPVAQAFFLFPVLTVAYRYGFKPALVAFGLATLAWFTASQFGWQLPPVWAFGAALLVMIVLLVREARRATPASDQVPASWLVDDDDSETPDWVTADDDDEAEDELFTTNVRRIKSNLPLIALLAGLGGAAYHWGIVAMDPLSSHLYAIGFAVPAAIVMLMWAFAFIPMKVTTAVVTGPMVTGTFLEPVVALLMPNVWAAAIGVAVLRVVEVFLLLAVIGWIERWPSIREVADVMRTAIFQVMEIGFLVGGALAAAAWAGTWGVGVVVAAWFLNIRAKSPVMPMSLGAIAALGVGVLVNLFAVVGLHLTP